MREQIACCIKTQAIKHAITANICQLGKREEEIKATIEQKQMKTQI